MPEKDAKDEMVTPLPPRRESQLTPKVLSPATVAALTPDVLDEIREKLGVDFRIRSSEGTVDSVAATVDTASFPTARAYDKVYDRTSPGYDRVYDRG